MTIHDVLHQRDDIECVCVCVWGKSEEEEEELS